MCGWRANFWINDWILPKYIWKVLLNLNCSALNASSQPSLEFKYDVPTVSLGTDKRLAVLGDDCIRNSFNVILYNAPDLTAAWRKQIATDGCFVTIMTGI